MISRRQIAELKQLAIEERDRRREAALEWFEDWGPIRLTEACRKLGIPDLDLTAANSPDKPIPDKRSCLKARKRRPNKPR